MVKVEDDAAAILKLGNVCSLRYDESTHQEMIIVTDRQDTLLQETDTEIGQSRKKLSHDFFAEESPALAWCVRSRS